MAETCASFAAWMPYALLAALAAGVGMGTFIRLGIDRAELAAYRRIAQSRDPWWGGAMGPGSALRAVRDDNWCITPPPHAAALPAGARRGGARKDKAPARCPAPACRP